MKDPRVRLFCASALFVSGLIIAIGWLLYTPSKVVGQEPPTANEEEFVELAPYMGQLQTLTHKLGLSIENSNHTLAEFYLYESLEALEELKMDVPEYRGLAIALLVDQMSTPAYKVLGTAIKEDKAEKTLTNKRSAVAYKTLIQTCNQCHVATKHEFIRISFEETANPFLQDFKPAKQ